MNDRKSSWDYWYKHTQDARSLYDYALPLSILQLDHADRAVLKIAGEYKMQPIFADFQISISYNILCILKISFLSRMELQFVLLYW